MRPHVGAELGLARQLERLGVDVIEAGFPIASDGDFEAVQAIAKEIQDATICGLARTGAMDVERAARAVANPGRASPSPKSGGRGAGVARAPPGCTRSS